MLLQNPTKFVVQYPSGSAKAGNAATVSKQVAKALVDKPGYVVRLSAHTDRSGKDDKNMVLSDLRANNVVEELVKAGIPQKRIITSPYGEMKNAKPTKDGVAAKANRRVEIYITE